MDDVEEQWVTTVTYVEHDGTQHVVDVENDMSLMEGATLNMVPGVEGMCGGVCSCATCHCYVPDEWSGQMPAMSKGEASMLSTARHRKANSRLGCQITVSDALEGLVVRLPPEQGSMDGADIDRS